MKVKVPTQIDNETLEINDTDHRTQGGPPGWIALAIVGGGFAVLASAVIIAAVIIQSI